jgi:hypothetical protein
MLASEQPLGSTPRAELFAAVHQGTRPARPHTGVLTPRREFGKEKAPPPDRGAALATERADRVWELLSACWAHDPARRPNAEAVVDVLASVQDSRISASSGTGNGVAGQILLARDEYPIEPVGRTPKVILSSSVATTDATHVFTKSPSPILVADRAVRESSSGTLAASGEGIPCTDVNRVPVGGRSLPVPPVAGPSEPRTRNGSPPLQLPVWTPLAMRSSTTLSSPPARLSSLSRVEGEPTERPTWDDEASRHPDVEPYRTRETLSFPPHLLRLALEPQQAPSIRLPTPPIPHAMGVPMSTPIIHHQPSSTELRSDVSPARGHPHQPLSPSSATRASIDDSLLQPPVLRPSLRAVASQPDIGTATVELPVVTSGVVLPARPWNSFFKKEFRGRSRQKVAAENSH